MSQRLPGQPRQQRDPARVGIRTAVVTKRGGRRKADARQAERGVVKQVEELSLDLEFHPFRLQCENAAERHIGLDKWIQAKYVASPAAELADQRLRQAGVGDQIRIVRA